MARVATGPVHPSTPPTGSSGATAPAAASGGGGSVKAVPPRERRKGSRNPLGVIGVLTEQNAPDKPLEVSVLNVSLHGCAFTSPVAFKQGATYTMRIGTGPLHLTSTLRIVSSRDRADGFFDVGAKFV